MYSNNHEIVQLKMRWSVKILTQNVFRLEEANVQTLLKNHVSSTISRRKNTNVDRTKLSIRAAGLQSFVVGVFAAIILLWKFETW